MDQGCPRHSKIRAVRRAQIPDGPPVVSRHLGLHQHRPAAARRSARQVIDYDQKVGHFHDLRGTAVTRLALSGRSAREIAAITGHSLKDVEAMLVAHYLDLGGRLCLDPSNALVVVGDRAIDAFLRPHGANARSARWDLADRLPLRLTRPGGAKLVAPASLLISHLSGA